ncbi:MAG: hypothetical protein L6R39_002813 [Caloplaca ligustica]|nr:MAG: hypothetical protein L6R39_002813 [Caloplaca ligustica]
MGAIRECFEESGILLARNEKDPAMLLQLSEGERESGRHAIHNRKIGFRDWVHSHGGIPDSESLYPFTRWLTPANIPKRFSTQMYLYFLPLAHNGVPQTMHIPSDDGGIEHTEAEFLPPREWLDQARADKIILFPPQFFLLSLVADFLPHLTSDDMERTQTASLQSQRDALVDFMKTGDPPWGEKCISPWPFKQEGKQLIMGLDDPGPELQGTSRKGDDERVIWVQFKGKEGTSGLRVGWRKHVTPEGLNEDERNAYVEARKGERVSGDRSGGVERALRGRKENL